MIFKIIRLYVKNVRVVYLLRKPIIHVYHAFRTVKYVHLLLNAFLVSKDISLIPKKLDVPHALKDVAHAILLVLAFHVLVVIS